MKLSEHINALLELQKHLGDLDPELLISVKDSHSVHGHDAVITMGSEPGRPWEGTVTNRDSGVTRLTVSLVKQEGKNSKITFRK